MAETWRPEDSQQLMMALRDHKERCGPCRKGKPCKIRQKLHEALTAGSAR